MRENFKLKIVSPFGKYELPFNYTKNGIIVDTQEKNNLGIRIASEMYGGSYPESWVAGWENDPFKSLLPCFISADGTAYICKDGDENSMAKMILKRFPDVVVKDDADPYYYVLGEGFVYLDRKRSPFSYDTRELPTNHQKNIAALFDIAVNNDSARCVIAMPELRRALHG